MFLAIKDTVKIGFINDLVITIFKIVCAAANKPGRTVCLTSAKDGEHGKNSYHKDGFAWDFDIIGGDFTKAEIKEITLVLKSIDQFIDVVYETVPGNEHLHVEYDLRRKAKKEKTTGETAVKIQTNKINGGISMSNTWKWVINVVGTILGPILKLVTAKFRTELEDFIQKKYTEAKETENPWDDFLFETLAGLFKISVE